LKNTLYFPSSLFFLHHSFSMDQVARSSSRGGTSLSHMLQDLIARGVSPTHFLMVNFEFDQSLSPHVRSRFSKRFFALVNNKTFSMALNPSDPDDKVHIKWVSPNATQSTFYYTVCRFDDTYMRQLTQMQIRETFLAVVHEMATEGVAERLVRVTFIPAKNVGFKIDLATGKAQHLGGFVSTRAATLTRIEEEESAM
jgi:hypothetical protein